MMRLRIDSVGVTRIGAGLILVCMIVAVMTIRILNILDGVLKRARTLAAIILSGLSLIPSSTLTVGWSSNLSVDGI